MADNISEVAQRLEKEIQAINETVTVSRHDLRLLLENRVELQNRLRSIDKPRTLYAKVSISKTLLDSFGPNLEKYIRDLATRRLLDAAKRVGILTKIYENNHNAEYLFEVALFPEVEE